MRRWRTLLALLCIAVIAAGVFVTADGSHDLLTFLAPVWQEFQPEDVVVAVELDSTAPAEQLVALRSLAPSRGPPPSVSA